MNDELRDNTPSGICEGAFCEVAPEVKLHYAQCGDPNAPLLLFVHGFPEFWFAWAGVMPAFAERWHVVAPDMRGYNLSSKPQSTQAYKPTALIADLVALIRQLGNGRATVVAHDWGGALAWGLAIAHPELVERLVILNAPHTIPFVRALSGDPEQQQASQYMNWLRRPGSEEKLAQNEFALLERFFVGDSGAPWFDGATRARYHAAWSQPGALSGGVNYYRASPLYPPAGEDPGAAKLTLHEQDYLVRVPTLVIWGEADPALRPVLLEGLERVVENLRIERMPQASHWLIHEYPAAVIELIRPFIES